MDCHLSGVTCSAAAGKPTITRYFQPLFNPALTCFYAQLCPETVGISGVFVLHCIFFVAQICTHLEERPALCLFWRHLLFHLSLLRTCRSYGCVALFSHADNSFSRSFLIVKLSICTAV